MPSKKNQLPEPVIDKKTVYQYVRSIFYLSADTDEQGTVESISRSMEFKGVGIWTLIFAVFIASLGLNTNSIAVIIGAMLISPLMGPIMGAGLSLGIYDFDMLRTALRNLAVMTVIGIATSTLYFLMPPLCTAGYGIATGNPKYFIGAFYLYIINSVFIGLTTFVFVKFFRFRRKTYIDKSSEKKFNCYILIVSLALIIPSVFMAYDVISESTFRKHANQYVGNNFNFEKSKVINRHYTRTPTKKIIEVTILGEPLSGDMISHLNRQLDKYDLAGAELRVIQYSGRDGGGQSSASYLESIKSKDEKILFLENRLKDLTDRDRLIARAVREVNILFPAVETISFGDLAVHSVKDFSSTKTITVLVKWRYKATAVDKKRLELYLKSRLEAETIQVMDVK